MLPIQALAKKITKKSTGTKIDSNYVKELKKRTHCNDCKAKGHWASDPKCSKHEEKNKIESPGGKLNHVDQKGKGCGNSIEVESIEETRDSSLYCDKP